MTMTMPNPVSPMASGVVPKAIILLVNWHSAGNTAKGDKSQLDVSTIPTTKEDGTAKTVEELKEEEKALKDRLRVSKELWSSKNYSAIGAHDAETSHYLTGLQVPGAKLKRGVYLLPLSLLTLAVNELKSRAATRIELVESFLQEYPSLVVKGMAELGPMAKAHDFEPVEMMRSKFSMDWQPLSFETPSSIMELDADMYAEAKAQSEAKLQSIVAESEKALHEGLSDLVGEMHRILTEDGKIFTTRVDKFKSFLEVFDARNMSGNDKLAEVAGKLKSVLGNVKAEDLKTEQKTVKGEKIKIPVNATVKETVVAALAGVKDALATMTLNKPERKMDLNLDELWD